MSCNSNIPVGYKIVDCKHDSNWNIVELDTPVIYEVPITPDCIVVCKTNKNIVLRDYKFFIEDSIINYENKLKVLKNRLAWVNKELEKEDKND